MNFLLIELVIRRLLFEQPAALLLLPQPLPRMDGSGVWPFPPFSDRQGSACSVSNI